MDQTRINNIAQLVSSAVEEGKFPGAVLLIGNRGKTLFHEAWGWAQLYPEKLPMTRDTVFDVASLTKLTGTWPGIMLLLQEGRMSLDGTIPEMLHHQKMHPALEKVTIRHLLTHTAGLIPCHQPEHFGPTRKERIDGLFLLPPEKPLGGQVLYSDLSFIFLGEILSDAMGERQDYVASEIFNALGMKNTGYLPPRDAYCAATEIVNGQTIRGRVHDEAAHQLGGVAGHAGVFSTAEDLGAFCANMLPGMQHPAFHEEWLRLSYQNQTAHLHENRALGWIAYHEKPEGNIVGHTGFTGTSIWMDTATGDYVVLLTNRVHPTRENSALFPIRREAFKMAFDAEI